MPVELFVRFTTPSPPTFTVTRFGIVCPPLKFRFEAVGIAVPDGYTVTNPSRDGPVTVTFITTAATPAGTPERPATWSATVEFAATAR
ncbi:hypothetical protein MSA03_26840 [Microbacterium saccharophilum]|nr:hypothetical protein MSA03_26840 [Microbacterium saccharophilum]